jgi:valyl-tRNA synthetase
MAKYNFKEEEKKIQDFWRKNNIFAYDKNSSKPIFSVDTPPLTVSGKLHMGHVFSYTQIEIIARYFRLAGYNIFYPIGMDDNGLPTDKLAEKELKIKSDSLPKEEYIKKVQSLVGNYHQVYTNIFQSLGFSYDWNLLYSTISPQIQKLTINNFNDFLKRGIIYQKKAPCLWCPSCHTGVAQAEIEDKETPSVFYDLKFGDLIISTTRPELLPACVAIFVNPKDKRYKKLIGKVTITPLGNKVKILADEKALMDKGTGAVMCCTYGDETDLEWKNKHNLEEKIIIDEFGKINGLSIKEARNKIVSELKSKKLITKETPIFHDVGVHERCGRPIEIILRDQYFVKILDIKDEILALADKINWYPQYMKLRLVNWVQNLKWDWCISRNRFYGIPIPGEKDLVFDTWFTSGNTPQINTLAGGKIPYSLRPQGHDIIRTWTFYTLVMAYYQEQGIPWENIAISGHLLLRKGQKISKKTGGGNLRPEEQIDLHSADAIRWTTAGSSLGLDSYYTEEEIQMGKKIVNKLFNAGNFVFSSLNNFDPSKYKITESFDKWIVNLSENTAQSMSKYFQKFDYSHSRELIHSFFWNNFCDYYLEIIKKRIYELDDSDPAKISAQSALYKTFLNILKMFAPFIPFITENLYQNYYQQYELPKSIHLTSWPQKSQKFIDKKTVNHIIEIISLVRGQKTNDNKPLNQVIKTLTIYHPSLTLDQLKPYFFDLLAITKSEKIIVESSKNVEIKIYY